MPIKPKLRLFDLTMIVISLVIGIGIFRTPAIVAQKAGTPPIFFIAWILGGIVSICGALTFAEIGSRFPTVGGFYKIFSHCYHPAYAFMLNWSIVITNAAASVGVALVGAEYINPVLPIDALHNDRGVKLIAIAVTLILFGLNYLGIRMGARTQNVLSMIKVFIIAGFCMIVFGEHHVISTSVIEPIQRSGMDIFKAFGVSLISVFFTYGGYQQTINFGADIQNPQRNVPRAIFAGMGIVILLYLCINFAYYSVLGFEGIQHSKLLAAELAKSFFGEKGAIITSVAIFISVLGFINTSMLSNPRVYYAMADDKVLPEIFQRVNPKTMAQEFSLTFFAALMILSLFLLGSFEKIVNYVMFIDTISLVSAAGTIFIFRKRAESGVRESPNIYKIKLFPMVPLLFMFVLVIVTLNILLSDPISALYGSVIFLAGYPLYKLLKSAIDR